jgi:peptidyl-prolyl cis-trans isomerase D
MTIISFLRKHMKIIFVFTIAGFVVATFAGFGGYYISKKSDVAVTVNRYNVYSDEYQKYFNEVLRKLQSEAKGKDVDMNMAKNVTIQSIVQDKLLLEQADKIGIQVPDKELVAIISNQPYFQTNKQFDQRLYYKILNYELRESAQEFESRIREKIRIDKTKMLLTETVKVSEKELEFAYLHENRNMINYQKDRETFKQNYLASKTNALLNAWFRSINEQSIVKVNK